MTFRQKIVTIGLAAAVLIGTAACTFGREGDTVPTPQVSAVEAPLTPGEVNLLDGHWQMAGVEVRGAERSKYLEVTAKSLRIVHQDGSPGYENPPVNLFGNRLSVDGDFSVRAKLQGMTGKVGFSLYGTPPLVEDEVRAEMATLDTSIDGTTLQVRVSRQPDGLMETRNFPIAAQGKHAIEIHKTGGKLQFVVDGRTVGEVAEQGIFASNQVWLGMDARTPGTRFQVQELRAQGVNGGKVGVVDTRQEVISRDPAGLSTLATARRGSFVLGAAVAPGPMASDAVYRSLLGNFNGVSIENVTKFQFVHPLPGNGPEAYNFGDADGLVEMATKAGMRIHGHAIVFGEANPAWVQELARTHPEQLQQVMIDHIKTVVGRYKGKIASWDINEVLADYDTQPGERGLRKHIWYQAMGPEYIAIAAQAIHEADPNAEIWINEFGLESDDERFDTMVALVKWLKAQNVPITGVGFQAHLDEDDMIRGGKHIDTTKLQQRIRTLASLGAKVRISELDITDDKQAPAVVDVVITCLSEQNCTGVTTWGVTDRYSSSGEIRDNGVYETGEGLLWNNKLQPTNALQLLYRALQ